MRAFAFWVGVVFVNALLLIAFIGVGTDHNLGLEIPQVLVSPEVADSELVNNPSQILYVLMAAIAFLSMPVLYRTRLQRPRRKLWWLGIIWVNLVLIGTISSLITQDMPVLRLWWPILLMALGAGAIWRASRHPGIVSKRKPISAKE